MLLSFAGVAHGARVLRGAPPRVPLLSRCAGSTARRCLAVRASVVDAGASSEAEEVEVKSEFLHTLKWRGFLQQATDMATLDDKLANGRVVAYLGFDATASSLHVGSLLQIMLLRHFQKCGHKPIVLVGERSWIHHSAPVTGDGAPPKSSRKRWWTAASMAVRGACGAPSAARSGSHHVVFLPNL